MGRKNETATKKHTGSYFERINRRLSSPKAMLILLFTGIFLALINFNARVSEAHDDSLYIEAAYRYIHEFPNYYYTANAPLYPMFLALLTLAFGTNLIAFKVFSVLFYIGGAILYYKALDKKTDPVLKLFVFAFLCINHLVLYYSSQTFSEAFYMLLQAVFFYFFCKYNFGDSPFTGILKQDLKKWLIIGAMLMILTVAKNILIFGVIAVVLYYGIRKQYKYAFNALASFALFKGLFELVKNMVWGKSAIQYTSQMGILLNKDPYDASQGQENVAGFIGRFTDNFGLYLGKRFYQMLGFLDENFTEKTYTPLNGEYIEKSHWPFVYFLAFTVLLLTVYGLYRSIKDKNYIVTFIVFFAGTISSGTFLVLQARWDQPRFLMVHMPAILFGMSYGLYRFCEKNSTRQTAFIGLMILVTGSMFISSFKRGVKNIPIVSKNLKGDVYYGYTPDWVNYLQLSAWCKDSLPQESYVACRKAPISFVYARGKHFYPVYSVIAKDPETNQSNPDSALAIFSRNKVTHLLIASLRIDPKVNSGDVINTLHNIAAPIFNKYPEKLTLVKTMGDSEQAWLYKINY